MMDVLGQRSCLGRCFGRSLLSIWPCLQLRQRRHRSLLLHRILRSTRIPMPRQPVHQACLWQQRGRLVCLPSRFLSRRKKQWFQRVHLLRLVAAREPIVFQLASQSQLGVELALLVASQKLLKRLPSALLSPCSLTHSHLRGSDSRLCSNRRTCRRWPAERQVDQLELLA